MHTQAQSSAVDHGIGNGNCLGISPVIALMKRSLKVLAQLAFSTQIEGP